MSVRSQSAVISELEALSGSGFTRFDPPTTEAGTSLGFELVPESADRLSEVMKILSANEDQWAERFASSFAAVLRPEQRATLPGEAGRVSYITGDATPEVAATMEHRHRIFIRESLQDGLYQALRALLPNIPEDLSLIHI